MKKLHSHATITLWAGRAITLLLAVLVFTLPMLLDWYCTVRILSRAEYMAIALAFYACAIVASLALWQMDGLLRDVLVGEVFVRKNVRRIRIISWCCVGVSLICLPAAFTYYPLVFVVIIMGFLSLVVSVVAQAFSAAVVLREENELTI